jgi:hypothetical protein
MSFLSYKDTRPWAKAIKTAVLSRQMPPWFADPAYGHFSNDKMLSDAEIRTLVAWADNGTLEGNPQDAPAPRVFHDGWNIQPDMIIEMPKDVVLPATGTITTRASREGQLHGRHVCRAMRPGNTQAVHHMRAIASTEFHMDEGMRFPVSPTAVIRSGRQAAESTCSASSIPAWALHLAYLSRPNCTKGSDIVFSIHYTSTGKPARIDRRSACFWEVSETPL